MDTSTHTKAGGGSVRSRMAASALDYNRSAWYRLHEKDHHYYPIYDDNQQQHQHQGQSRMHKGTFYFSKFPSWVPESLVPFHGDLEYEGYGFCAATTPLGMTIACPNEQDVTLCQDRDNDTISDHRCDIIYMGHNLLGNEFHWLPKSYMVQWWKNSRWGRDPNHSFVTDAIQDRDMEITTTWHVPAKIQEIVGGADNIPNITCRKGPYKYWDLKGKGYQNCFQPKEAVMDQVSKYVMGDDPLQAARLTSNLPILRVTVLREPFSWLMSKFFWHPHHYSRNNTMVIPNKGAAWVAERRKDDTRKGKQTPPLIHCDDVEEAAHGWVAHRAMMYLFYLCGEHCMGGWAAGTLSLEDLERQAAYNLRHSFAVVGLLHKTDEFYQMVTQRVHYMNTALNPNVTGKLHESSTAEEALRCKAIYKNTTYQQELLSKSPVLRALARIYDVAVEVNEFQKKEMVECGHEILDTSTSTAEA
jgi:hypothetical protein